METETTVKDNFENHPVQSTIKGAAAITLCAVAGWKTAGWVRSKIDARKDRKAEVAV